MSPKTPDHNNRDSLDVVIPRKEWDRLILVTRLVAAGLLTYAGVETALKISECGKCEQKPTIEKREVKSVAEAHQRIEDQKYGTVHAWHPDLKVSPEEVVVFVHGYSTNNHEMSADKAYNGYYDLQKQFQNTGRKALFVVPDAPHNHSESIRDLRLWDRNSDRKNDVRELVQIAAREMGISLLPKTPITIVAHSGGYTTAAAWSEIKEVKEIVLLDALYGLQDRFHRFAQGGGKLKLVATEQRTGSLSRNRRFMRHYQDSENVEYTESYDSHADLPKRWVRKTLTTPQKDLGLKGGAK